MLPDAGRSTTTADAVCVERDEAGHRRLVTTETIPAGEEILEIEGVRRTAPTRYSIQIGPHEHLDDMGPVNATNHACDPSALVDFSDPERIVLRALRDLAPGDEISIHYCATEYDMASPFDCHCGAADCLSSIRGYRWVSGEAARRLEPWLRPGLRGAS